MVGAVSLLDTYARAPHKPSWRPSKQPSKPVQVMTAGGARASRLDEHLAAGDYPALMGVSASGALDQPGNDTVPYTVQRAIDEFEFGLQCILDGIEARIMGVRGQSERRA